MDDASWLNKQTFSFLVTHEIMMPRLILSGVLESMKYSNMASQITFLLDGRS